MVMAQNTPDLTNGGGGGGGGAGGGGGGKHYVTSGDPRAALGRGRRYLQWWFPASCPPHQ